jgi:hypothetical protein
MIFEGDTQAEKFLDGVERVDRSPLILSRWGFKKVEVEGRTALLAMTKEEMLEAMEASGNYSRDQIDRVAAAEQAECFTDGYAACYATGQTNCTHCRWQFYSQARLCVCDQYS